MGGVPDRGRVVQLVPPLPGTGILLSYSLPGPLRRSSAHTATWSGAVALVVDVQHSSRAARWGPCSTGDIKEMGTLGIDACCCSCCVVVELLLVAVVVELLICCCCC